MKRFFKMGVAIAASLILSLSSLLPWLPTAPALAQETSSPPNILVIMADDVGWFNLSSYNDGMLGYRTTNIDRIAESGIRFTDAYAENSCTAGRSAFITGQSPGRTGLTKVGLPGAELGISTQDITLAEILKEQGYATGQFGKNHLGDLDKFLPTNHGFEEFYGNLYHLNAEEEPEHPDYPENEAFFNIFGPRGVIHSYDKRVDWAPKTVADANALQTALVPDRPCTPERDPENEKKTDSYVTEEILQGNPEGLEPDVSQVICNTGALDRTRMETVDEEFRDATLAFMEKAVNVDKKPFFVWFNPSRMHAYTRLKSESQGVTGQGIYADGLKEHDILVGELLDKLDELDVADNTIVIYTSDNGAPFFHWPDGGLSPFHGEKNTNWEGGFRVPFLVSWPARWNGGIVSNDIISMLDWLPTLTEATGISELQDIGEQLLNPCLDEDELDPEVCDMNATPSVPLKPFYQANGRDFEPLHLDGYNFLPRLDYLDAIHESPDPGFFFPEKAPRHEIFYLTDDAYPSALRFDDWKVIFGEQRAKGARVWSEPFVSLRSPLIFNLRRDPFERAPEESTNYYEWRLKHAFVIAPAQAYVANFLDTFRDYPPRQIPASFGIDSLLEDLENDLKNMTLED